MLRDHWLVTVLLAAGLVLRILTLIAYRPALIYVDSTKYLYSAYPGADPVGYKLPLRAILLVGNLTAVAAVQHLAGLAIAVTVYAVLTRAGAARWLAALATALILLDGYQLQIEQTIMPDVWFELLIVAGVAVLLWKQAVSYRAVIAAGLMLGASATIRQVGEILLLPALLFLAVAGGSWARRLARGAVMTAAFAVPILGYCTGSYVITGHFWLASANPLDSTYGRMAAAADCGTLRLTAAERLLCPNPRQQAWGPDWLDHDVHSPLKTFRTPPGQSKYAIVAGFNKQVVLQQPERVTAAIARDAVKLFALTRTSSQGGTPIWRWQFQDSYPLYTGTVEVNRQGVLMLSWRVLPTGGPVVTHPLDPSYGGKPAVIRPVAEFLRGYQLHGGYAPGPVMLVFTLTGLAGSLTAFARRRKGRAAAARRSAAAAPGASAPSQKASAGAADRPGAEQRSASNRLAARDRNRLALRRLSLCCLLWYGSGLAILLASDAFQFSWRYQLPALVTLPPAGVLGVAVITGYLTRRPAAAAAAPGRPPELAAPSPGSAVSSPSDPSSYGQSPPELGGSGSCEMIAPSLG